MKKIMIKIMTLLLVCTLLFGCGARNSDENQNAGGAVILTTADPDDKREVVTLGVWQGSTDLMLQVNGFNETNEKYRIEVIAYPSMEYEDYYTSHAMRILSGRGEDLLFGNMRMQTYIDKGVLVDLLPYMERDLKKEDYIEEILYAYEVKGGIYGICPSFGISVMLGGKEYMGDGKIRFEDLSGLMKETGATTLMARIPMETLWYLYSYFSMNLTDRQELKEGILLAEAYGDSGEEGRAVDLRLGRDALFLELSMNLPIDVIRAEMAYGSFGVETEIMPRAKLYGSSICINNASEKKEGAWEFIRFLLSEEYQAKLIRESFTHFPISRKAFADKTEAALESLERQYKDINVEIPIKKERYLELMETWIQGSRSEKLGIDYDAWRIVSEEVEAYYSGQKSLDEVLDIIESRMRIYLGEKE